MSDKNNTKTQLLHLTKYDVIVVTGPNCTQCMSTKRYMNSKGVDFIEIDGADENLTIERSAFLSIDPSDDNTRIADADYMTVRQYVNEVLGVQNIPIVIVKVPDNVVIPGAKRLGDDYAFWTGNRPDCITAYAKYRASLNE